MELFDGVVVCDDESDIDDLDETTLDIYTDYHVSQNADFLQLIQSEPPSSPVISIDFHDQCTIQHHVCHHLYPYCSMHTPSHPRSSQSRSSIVSFLHLPVVDSFRSRSDFSQGGFTRAALSGTNRLIAHM